MDHLQNQTIAFCVLNEQSHARGLTSLISRFVNICKEENDKEELKTSS